jgi:type I restriction enzyme R subunit
MSPHPYTEDQLVEQPAIALLAELGWQSVSALEEILGPDGTLGRETKSEVVLSSRLKAALTRLNPDVPPEGIAAAIDQLIADRSAMSLVAGNREVYALLKEGVPVSVREPERGAQRTLRVRVIDWQTVANNDFLVVNQFSITGSLYTCRPDLVGFVNGLPLVVVELKKPGVPAKQAFDENLTSYKHELNGVPQLFWYNAFLIASNGTESRVGSLTADWERFFEWKRVEREDEPRRVSLEVMLRGVAEPGRLLDLVENFTVFSEHKTDYLKILAQNHQFLGVNNSIASMLEARRAGHGRAGVFWQTQGSGKSLSMVFFAQKVLRRVPGNWTFVVVTDRTELDDQIARTFKETGAVSDADSTSCHAGSGAHLRQLLTENHRYVFTLIHKFQTPEMLCDRPDVVVLTDEAHRSQYDTLALNMRSALPKALFIAFTGTPLIAGEERTREVFGDYVSIYDFQQSVEDGATVRLFYENRTPELRLQNPSLNDDIYALVEAAELDEDQEKRLERELGRQYHLLTRGDRLDTIAKDVVRHFLGRGFQGKAMVVSIDKATALRMYDKVHAHWEAERTRVENELARAGTYASKLSPEEVVELEDRLHVLTTTDMAVVVSPAQNEIEQMRQLGIEIAPHRKRMNDEALDDKFKDPDDPLRLVFVCAMWLTGFDAPSCSTIYLDKPMRNHTLMQTVARANRVFPGKHSGLIVDYANVFASLEKALAIYGKGSGGATPVRDKQELVEDLRGALVAAIAFCLPHGVDVAAIAALSSGGMQRLSGLADAVDRLIAPDPIRKDFLAHERLVHALYQAVKPDPVVPKLEARHSAECWVVRDRGR